MWKVVGSRVAQAFIFVPPTILNVQDLSCVVTAVRSLPGVRCVRSNNAKEGQSKQCGATIFMYSISAVVSVYNLAQA